MSGFPRPVSRSQCAWRRIDLTRFIPSRVARSRLRRDTARPLARQAAVQVWHPTHFQPIGHLLQPCPARGEEVAEQAAGRQLPHSRLPGFRGRPQPIENRRHFLRHRCLAGAEQTTREVENLEIMAECQALEQSRARCARARRSSIGQSQWVDSGGSLGASAGGATAGAGGVSAGSRPPLAIACATRACTDVNGLVSGSSAIPAATGFRSDGASIG